MPQSANSCVYVTWGYGHRRNRKHIARRDLEKLTEQVREDLQADSSTFAAIRRAVEPLASPHDAVSIEILMSDEEADAAE